MVELLVGCGADVTSTVDDGNTALMLVLTQKKMKPLDQDTPHLNHVSLVYCKVSLLLELEDTSVVIHLMKV